MLILQFEPLNFDFHDIEILLIGTRLKFPLPFLKPNTLLRPEPRSTFPTKGVPKGFPPA
jgi:hypothetical protein